MKLFLQIYLFVIFTFGLVILTGWWTKSSEEFKRTTKWTYYVTFALGVICASALPVCIGLSFSK